MICADILFSGVVKEEYRARIAKHATFCDWSEFIDIPGVNEFVDGSWKWEHCLPNRKEVYAESLAEAFPNSYDEKTGEWNFICGFNEKYYFTTFCGFIEYIIPVIFESVSMFEMVTEFADPERWINGYRINGPEEIERWFHKR